MTTIVYHGLGYVGLTGACHFKLAGVRDVIGYDPSQEVVDAINAGRPKANEFLGYLGADQAPLPRATTSWSEVAHHGIHILAVPTERVDEPFMDIVLDVVTRLLATIPSGGTIIIESTLTPGTIDTMLARPGGRRVIDGEVFLIHAPRRDWFADPAKNVSNMVRVVGTYGNAAGAMALAILGIVTPPDKIRLTHYRVAELVKPLENALFQAPISIAHEMAVAYPHVDVAEAVELASTHWRFASMGGLYVGLGAGGRCVPMGPKYLAAGTGRPAIATTDLNYANGAVVEALGRWIADRTSLVSVTVCGVAYRPDFADFGGSPGLALADRLMVAGKRVRIHDPFVVSSYRAHTTVSDADLPTILGASDVIVLGTPHAPYVDLVNRIPWRSTSLPQQVVFDARGLWAGKVPSFVDYRRVGSAGWLGP